MESINAKYVSQKISKTRWKPVSYSTLQQPDVFATGSWDNEVGKLTVNINDKIGFIPNFIEKNIILFLFAT